MAGNLADHIKLRKVAANTYGVSWHPDWSVGTTLFGGAPAAQIHLAAVTHLTTDAELRSFNQPDILRIHYNFLRTCDQCDSVITVGTVKAGTIVNTLQITLSQNGTAKVTAVVTSTNFAKSLGPSYDTQWKLNPAPAPTPDFKRVEASQPEDNWVPHQIKGEVAPITGHLLSLYPRHGFPDVAIVDSWQSWLAGERVDATGLTMMTDFIPCMSDTMLRTGGIFDANRNGEIVRDWAEKNPGRMAVITNSTAEAMTAPFFNITATLDIEYKRRLPKEGLRWIFTRTMTKMLQGGRMDAEITMCNEDMELLCNAQQTILALDVGRRFKLNQKKASSL